ncbi:unnamed protein product [Darwinula stevensoni]|uniref:alcohol dehydrogenase n=1 Tax=Darwinula stevensoni TaxID=69355 RepID=A0A7R9A482_9CRUS|nr:unnamed protein product [Darwinula stevensoni]CAG0892034.1 unnamed protein product [Darwinula stevensoni]
MTASSGSEAGTRCSFLVFLGKDRHPSLIHETAPLPSRRDLEDGELLLKMETATICGSDLRTLTGQRTQPTPSILGHEGVGRVLSSKREGVDPGTRVTFSTIDACFECHACLAGLPQKCPHLLKYGERKIQENGGLSGCFSTHVLVRKRTRIVAVPDLIPDPAAATLNCGMATAVGCLRKAIATFLPRLNSARACVQGLGLVGVYSCMYLREAGFSEVLACDKNDARLQMASHFGATRLFRQDWRKEEEEDDEGVDLVVETSGDPRAVEEGLAMLKPGGVYLLIGTGHSDALFSLSGEDILSKCLTITGMQNCRPEDLDEAVRFLEKTIGTYPYEKLFSPPFPLHQFQALWRGLEQTSMTVMLPYRRPCRRLLRPGCNASEFIICWAVTVHKAICISIFTEIPLSQYPKERSLHYQNFCWMIMG